MRNGFEAEQTESLNGGDILGIMSHRKTWFLRERGCFEAEKYAHDK